MNHYDHCMSTAVDTDMQISSCYIHENLSIILCHSYIDFIHWPFSITLSDQKFMFSILSLSYMRYKAC